MTTPISPVAIGENNATNQLCEIVGCNGAAGGSSVQHERVIADYLRHYLCHLGRSDKENELPSAVHVHRLLAAVRRQLGAWLPEKDQPDWVEDADQDISEEEDEAKPEEVPVLSDLGIRLLRRLVFLRETAQCGRGFYLPVPTRVVTLPSGSALAVSGLPTKFLISQIQSPVKWAGTCRTVSRELLAGIPLSVPRQPLDSWMELPGPDLAAWTNSVLANAAAELKASSSDANQLHFEVYAPTPERANQYQHQRWIVPSDLRRIGGKLSLCRTVSRPYRFWLAPLETTRRGAHFRSEASLPARIARRLMYGLDQQAGTQVTVRIESVPNSANEKELRLSSWPAWEELRLLHALATDVTPQKQNLPMRFRYANVWWPDIFWALKNLGVVVKDQDVPN